MPEITKMNDTTFEEDITLDPDALDVEILRCGQISHKYIKLAKHLRALEKKAHENVKNLRSDLIHVANQDPEGTTGKAKPNASDIEAYYRRASFYQHAKAAHIAAEYEADYADSAQQAAIYGRRKDLELLVRLFERNYFAGPAVARNLTKEWEEKSTAGIAKKLNRTTKG